MNILLIIAASLNNNLWNISLYSFKKSVLLKKMIYLSISILVFFIFLQIQIFDSLGYPVYRLDFPKKVLIFCMSRKSESQFIMY